MAREAPKGLSQDFNHGFKAPCFWTEKRLVLINYAVCTEGATDFSPGVRNANGVSLPGVHAVKSVVP